MIIYPEAEVTPPSEVTYLVTDNGDYVVTDAGDRIILG